MSDPRYIYRPLLDLTGTSEGTDRADGYNETLGYGAFTGGDVNLVGMTLDEIDALQTAMLAHPGNRWNSSAVGRYQIVRKTLRSIRQKLGLAGTALFDAGMQDRCACFLLGKRGIDRFVAGRMSENAMINSLAKEWASLPTVSGQGYYGGQRAAVSVRAVRQALAEVKRRAKSPSKPADAQKPVATGGKPSGPLDFTPAPLPVGKTAGLGLALVALGGLVARFWDRISDFLGGLF